LKLFTDRD